jgi:hypothetical protein
MSDTEAPSSDFPRLSEAEVVGLWDRYRAGEAAQCPRDGAGVALAVDAAAKSYRLICTHCGLASPWFGSSPSGIHFRTAAATIGPGELVGEETTDEFEL